MTRPGAPPTARRLAHLLTDNRWLFGYLVPGDDVPWLLDRKWCHIRIEGTTFGDVPLMLETKLEVWDSPNSAGVVIDAVRAAKIALDRGIGGPLYETSAYFMKSPPRQMLDEDARDGLEAFIAG